MSEDVQPKPVKTTRLMRRVIIYAALLLVVFLLASSQCGSSLVNAPVVFLRQRTN